MAHTYHDKLQQLFRFVMHNSLKESLEYVKKNGIKSLFEDGLMEMMMVNRVEDFSGLGMSVWMYGNDRPNYTPHFHLRTKKEELEISIETLQILHIKGRKLKDISWTGYRKERKALEEWLMYPSKRMTKYTNYESIMILWNFDNPNNEVKVFQPTAQFIRYGLYGTYSENQ